MSKKENAQLVQPNQSGAQQNTNSYSDTNAHPGLCKDIPLTIGLSDGGHTNTTVKPCRLNWGQFCSAISNAKVGKKDGAYLTRCAMRENYRSNDNAETGWLLVIDADSSLSIDADGVCQVVEGVCHPEEAHEAFKRLDLTSIVVPSYSNLSKGEGFHKWRAFLPVELNTQEELTSLVAWVIHNLAGVGVSLVNVQENNTISQPWYRPRCCNENALEAFRTYRYDANRPFPKAEAMQWAADNPESVPAIKPDGDKPTALSERADTIGLWLQQHNNANELLEVLGRNGFSFKSQGRLYNDHATYRLCDPASVSGNAGVVVFVLDSGLWAAFSHHSHGVLADGHAHDLLSLVAILEHGGDIKAAMRALGIEAQVETCDEADIAPAEEVESERLTMPAPYPGVMADAVEASLAHATKPQPDLCTMAALIGMAAACGGSDYQLGSGMRLNLYANALAATGSGKDQPRSLASKIATAAGAQLIPVVASGQGLEDELTGKPALLEMDEIGFWFGGITDKNAQSHQAMLASMLLQLFSASKGEYRTRRKAGSKDGALSRTIKNPCLSIYGSSTPEKLGRSLSAASAEDGLIGRFLFVMGDDHVPARRVKGAFTLPESVLETARAISSMAGLGAEATTIGVEPEADSFMVELMTFYDTEHRRNTNAMAKILLVRSYEKLERIAGVLAVWDCPTKPVITMSHVQWARQLVDASNAAVLKFTSDFMHGSKTFADAAEIRKALRRCLKGDVKPQRRSDIALIKKGVISKSMVMRVARLDAKDMAAALDYLIGIDEIGVHKEEITKAGGKKTSLIYLGFLKKEKL